MSHNYQDPSLPGPSACRPQEQRCAALGVGVAAAVVVSDDEPEITAATTQVDDVDSDVATNTGNDALDSGAREGEDVPGTGESEPEVDEPVHRSNPPETAC